MEKLMNYLLDKLDWDKSDPIDVIYLINQLKLVLVSDQQAQLYIQRLIDSNLDNRLTNKYIEVALNHIKVSELSSLLQVSEMEAKYKAENEEFTAVEYEKLRNVGSIYMERNKRV